MIECINKQRGQISLAKKIPKKLYRYSALKEGSINSHSAHTAFLPNSIVILYY